MSKPLLSACACALLSLHGAPIWAAEVTLTHTYALGSALAAWNSNYNPQGMGYDSSANELLFIQQSTNSIVRTDLTGQVLGTRSIGNLPITPNGGSGTANHTVSVAADAGNYYFTDYTCNASCRDLYSIDKTAGAAVALSNEVAAYGGYPIDVRNGQLYRTNVTTGYSNGNLNQIRVSSLAAPDSITTTLTLTGGLGIADFAVDTDHGALWVLDYVANASIRRYDLATGVFQEAYALGLDGLTAGMTYANGTLYHYDWNSGSGSTLRTYAVSGLANLDNGNDVPEPGSLALMLGALGALALTRRRAAR